MEQHYVIKNLKGQFFNGFWQHGAELGVDWSDTQAFMVKEKHLDETLVDVRVSVVAYPVNNEAPRVK